ncbi:right-handed parallel beta-helix repeat-containing protein [Palleronia sp.]|uniref:right-handed parallel beta-helix repeat-containing protein n=1 Tax=Palleronia sp. TaxID=1940284 RepID=UPI0035C80F33
MDSPEQLSEALRMVAPGSVIELAPGEYGAVRLDGIEGLNLTAAQPDDPPVLSELVVTNSADITFEHLVLDYRAAHDAPLWHRMVEVRNATGISFHRVLFDGDLAKGGAPEDLSRPTGTALTIRDSQDVTIRDSEFRRFERGIVLSGSDDIVIRDNHLHRLRHDGITMAAVRHVRIEGNRIGNFDRPPASADHPDMIQMFSTGTDRPSEDIRITDNLLLSGHGLWTQSIHLRNERVDQGEAGSEMFYRDIEISGNVIANAHLNGILVGETQGLVIRRNTLIRNGRSAGPNFSEALATPIIRVAPAARDVVIEDNVTPVRLHPEGRDWRVEGNIALGVAGYDSALVDARTGDPLDVTSYAYRADGPLAGRGLGAPALEPVP